MRNLKRLKINEKKSPISLDKDRVYEYSFINGKKVSMLEILVNKSTEGNLVANRSRDDATPLAPPFSDFWQLANNVRGILMSLPAQEIIIKVTGQPYVYYYLFRMLSWFPEKHKLSIEADFNSDSSENFLMEKMRQYVLESIENYKLSEKVTFPTDYALCKECFNYNKSDNLVHGKFGNATIDVVIPTKGVPQSQLEECINSIQVQLEDTDVVYLVNDNSPDSKICEAIAVKYPKVVVIEGSHRGIGATRNIGAKAGSNSLIAFVDSDDYVLPGYFELQRSFHSKHHDVASTGTWLQSFGAHELVYPQWDGISPIGLLACLPPAGVLIWKREAISSIGYFNEEFVDGFEDFDLVARAISRQMKIFVIDLPLYRYRRGHQSLSQSWSKDRELELQLKVSSNLRHLCSHEFRKYLDLSNFYGNKLLLSHPDLVFGYRSKLGNKSSRYYQNRMWINLIQKTRNVVWLRRLWNKLSPNLRLRINNYLIK
jgi:glycosyltransferase involved in cell wall biosynthesis